MSKKRSKPSETPKPPRTRSALARESERALVQQIRRLQALPPERRTNFLRVRLPNGGSAL